VFGNVAQRFLQNAEEAERDLVLDLLRQDNEPFCTVLPKEMSDPMGVSRRQLPAKPDGLLS
jgi:hypothetical protein